MADISKGNETGDESRCSLDDSGVDFMLFESTSAAGDKMKTKAMKKWEHDKKAETESLISASGALADLFLSRKKLKEAETQVKSLALILGQASSENSSGIDLLGLRQSKALLEHRVRELRGYIRKKESEVGRNGESWVNEEASNELSESQQKRKQAGDQSLNLSETEDELISGNLIFLERKTSCCSSTESDKIAGECLDGNEASERSESGFEELEMVGSDENSFLKHLRVENSRLRKRLSETSRKQKVERNRVIEQLKVLEVEAMDGERNWRNELRKKQLRIEDLLSKSDDLVAKNKELTDGLTECEKLRRTESLENEKNVKKKEEVISQIKTKLARVRSEKEKLETDLKELHRALDEAQESTKIFAASKDKMKYELGLKKEDLEEANKKVEGHSKEMDEIRTRIKELMTEVESLKDDKKNLSEQLEILTSQIQLVDEKGLSQEKVSLQTTQEYETSEELCSAEKGSKNGMEISRELRLQVSGEKNCMKSLKEKEVCAQKVSALKERLLQKDSTILELTISLAKSIEENNKLNGSKLQADRRLDSDVSKEREKKDSPSNLPKIMEKVKKELAGIQEDVKRHKENVRTLGDRWRNYKSSMQEIRQELVKTLN